VNANLQSNLFTLQTTNKNKDDLKVAKKLLKEYLRDEIKMNFTFHLSPKEEMINLE
jgi:hypothetical protein